MLSRTANNLFWMGRYLERAQHTSRFVHVHFLSALDAPTLTRKEFVLDPVSNMVGLKYEYVDEVFSMKDEELIYKILLDLENPVSLITTVYRARENARSARDIISSELWESMNKFYHKINQKQGQNLSQDQIMNLTEMVAEQCAIVAGYIHHSLIHNEIYSLIQLGIHTEAAAQITRILIAKVQDIIKAEKNNLGKAMETYQCITLLKSLEAFDMSRIYYKSIPNLQKTLGFLILNKDFPRSVLYNLNEAKKCLEKIKLMNHESKDSPEFLSGKLTATLNFLTIEEIEKDVPMFLEETLSTIYTFSNRLTQKIS